jgi:hypothetical protein
MEVPKTMRKAKDWSYRPDGQDSAGWAGLAAWAGLVGWAGLTRWACYALQTLYV